MRTLVPLGRGVYTVAEVCRILQPGMTRRKVHYWLDTGLLSEPPVAHEGSGVPTLLSFQQLLEVRTVQRLRDDLKVSLDTVREAFHWILANLFAELPSDVRFERSHRGTVIAVSATGEAYEIPTNQRVLEMRLDDTTLAGLNAVVHASFTAWQDQAFRVPTHPGVVANARVVNGAPTIEGTRMETSIVAAFAETDGQYGDETVAKVVKLYPYLQPAGVRSAFEFEGVYQRAS